MASVICIALVAHEQRDGVRVQVHDDGPGFPSAPDRRDGVLLS
jgi:signal transduction histidine kinase